MKPRVLCLIKGLGLGGAEQLLCSGLSHRSRDEFEYEVGYLLPWKDALVSEIERQGVKVTCFEARSSYDPRAFLRILRYLRRNKIDVLHAHLPVASIWGRMAGRMCRVPAVVYTEHGMWMRLNRMTRFVNRASWRLNDLTIAISADVARTVPHCRGGQLVTVTNGVDSNTLMGLAEGWETVRAEFGLPEEDLLIGKVANLSPIKDHESLIRAFARFRADHPRSSLVLVGQLRSREQVLWRLADKLGIAEALVISGPRTDVPRLVQSFDVFAISSRSEGIPISLLEAMALGKPVVCTSVGGIPGVVTDGREGFLVPTGRPDLMAERFARLASDPQCRQRMGEAGKARVRESFEISAAVRRTEQCYRELLNGRAAHHDRHPPAG